MRACRVRAAVFINQETLFFLPYTHQCIDEEGFRLFLNTYLEVEEFPQELCERLFKTFKTSDEASESLKPSALSLACFRPVTRLNVPLM